MPVTRINSVGARNSSSLFRMALLSIILIIQSCYSTTAIKGTPVKDLVLAKDQRVTRKIVTKQEREEVARISMVRENKVFTEVSGIPEYRIGPLDILEINSHVGDQMSTATARVDNRGRISYSFIDDLDVVGLTPSQLDDLLSKKLSAYVRNPRIDVLVKEFRSKNAMALGELASLRSGTVGTSASGRTYLQGKTTLMDLIALAGGYTVNADIKNIQLIREGKTYPINLYDIIEKGDQSQNVIIDDGDVVNIPELPAYRERVYVLGEVNGQGIYSLKEAQDLLAAISLAGSFTRLAKEENTLIVRGYEPGKAPLVMMADLNALLREADISQNIPLEDGDLVYVPRMKIGDINDWIANTMPLLTFLFYPKSFESQYLMRDYLHLDRHHHK